MLFFILKCTYNNEMISARLLRVNLKGYTIKEKFNDDAINAFFLIQR